MKVISLLQPWATLVVIGAKKIETRSWNTKFRGEILIHASQKMSAAQKRLFKYPSPFYDCLKQYSKLQDNLRTTWDIPRGAIIGKVNIVDTLPSEYLMNKQFSLNIKGTVFMDNGISKQELAFGDYSHNRYGWLLSDPVQFAIPTPAKGQLGIWNYDLPDHFHVPNKYGGHATFPTPPDQKTIDAVNAMVEIARKNLK